MEVALNEKLLALGHSKIDPPPGTTKWNLAALSLMKGVVTSAQRAATQTVACCHKTMANYVPTRHELCWMPKDNLWVQRQRSGNFCNMLRHERELGPLLQN